MDRYIEESLGNELAGILEEQKAEIIKDIKDLEPEFSKTVDDNFWSLI